MSTLTFDAGLVPLDVVVDDAMIRVKFASGLELATPVARFPRLQRATPEQRSAWRLVGRGDGIHWPDVDEDVSVKGLFAGTRRVPVSSVEATPLQIDEFSSVWEALGFSDEEAASLEVRSMLMMQLRTVIKERGMTPTVAATRCGVPQSQINDLLRGKIDKFSIDALVNMAAGLGRKVRLEIEAA